MRIRTNNGFLDFNRLSEYNYTIEEIATILSRLPRYCAHGRTIYTVGMHSICCDDNSPGMLYHDFHEAYTGDLTSVLCDLYTDYVSLKSKVQFEIERHLNIQHLYDAMTDVSIRKFEMLYLFEGIDNPVHKYAIMTNEEVRDEIIRRYNSSQQKMCLRLDYHD